MRVLIVDDDLDICWSVKTQLEAMHLAVDVAHTGKDGSYMARTADYDLIILDYVMPQGNGDEVCREVRAAGKAAAGSRRFSS